MPPPAHHRGFFLDALATKPSRVPSCLIYGYIDAGNGLLVLARVLARNESLASCVGSIGGIVELKEVSR